MPREELVEALRGLVDNPDASGDNRHVRMKWTIDLGQILQVVTLCVTFGGSAWTLSATMAEMKKDIAGAVVLGSTLTSDLKAIAARTDALAKANEIQDERIGNLAATASEDRRQRADIIVSLGQIKEDLATVRAKLSLEKR